MELESIWYCLNFDIRFIYDARNKGMLKLSAIGEGTSFNKNNCYVKISKNWDRVKVVDE